MRLTDFIIDAGRSVAYFPGLKKITGSTTATIFLCQMLYWVGKKGDNWIWKTSEEIEEETGLTYNEQKTAREKLVELKVLVEERKPLDHTMRFKVNIDVFNQLYEDAFEMKPERVVVEESVPEEQSAEDYFKQKTIDRNANKPPVTRDPIERGKKGDMVDGMIALQQSNGMKKADALLAIKMKIEKRLRVFCNGKKWQDFIEFAYNQDSKNKEAIDVFITYVLGENYNPIYFPPDKLITLWPQAFTEEEPTKLDEFFVQPVTPQVKKQEYAPMPEGLRKKNLD
jgi:hypothetical protein